MQPRRPCGSRADLGLTMTNSRVPAAHTGRPHPADRIERSYRPYRRTLGTGGPAVSAIGLGCMGMTGFYGEPDAAESIRTLRRAVELGCTFWDTSDAYGPHSNERLLARVLAHHRDEVF